MSSSVRGHPRHRLIDIAATRSRWTTTLPCFPLPLEGNRNLRSDEQLVVQETELLLSPASKTMTTWSMTTRTTTNAPRQPDRRAGSNRPDVRLQNDPRDRPSLRLDDATTRQMSSLPRLVSLLPRHLRRGHQRHQLTTTTPFPRSPPRAAVVYHPSRSRRVQHHPRCRRRGKTLISPPRPPRERERPPGHPSLKLQPSRYPHPNTNSSPSRLPTGTIET